MAISLTAVDMAYDVHGDEDVGCPLIMMHGWYWNRRMFSTIAQKLAKASRRKVYNIDMRGHGDSPNTKEKINKEIMMEDLKLFLDSKDIPKVSFVCHSLSCAFAHMLAVDQPHRVDKIVMVDYHPYRGQEEINMSTNTSQILIENRFLNNLNKEECLSLSGARKKLLHHPCDKKGQRTYVEKLANDLIQVNGKFQWKTDVAYLRERCNSADFIRQPNEIYEGPLLIIRGGDSDVVHDAKFEFVLKYNPNAKLETFANTSHLLQFEETDKFIKTVCEFLDSDE